MPFVTAGKKQGPHTKTQTPHFSRSHFLTVSLSHGLTFSRSYTSHTQRRFIFDEMNSVSILPVTPASLDILVRLSRKIFYDSFHHMNTPANMAEYMDRAFNPQQLLSELNNPSSEFYFITVNEMIAGYLKINQGPAQSDLHEDDCLEIERIYVDHEFQGQSLGARLLEKAKGRAVELNLNHIWLGVWEKNPDAIRFYQRHGFEIFGSHPFRMGDEVQTDILMQCKV
jgi:diamine N-acetyltransferase